MSQIPQLEYCINFDTISGLVVTMVIFPTNQIYKDVPKTVLKTVPKSVPETVQKTVQKSFQNTAAFTKLMNDMPENVTEMLNIMKYAIFQSLHQTYSF